MPPATRRAAARFALAAPLLLLPASLAAAADSDKAIRQYCEQRYPAPQDQVMPTFAPQHRMRLQNGAADGMNAVPQAAPSVAPQPQARPEAEAAAPPPAASKAGQAVYDARSLSDERYAATEPGATLDPATDPVSTFGADVDTAAYGHVRRWLAHGRLPPADAVRPEELINAFAYDYPAPAAASDAFRPTISLHPAPWDAGKRILHIGVRAYDPPDAARPPANLVFLVDASGSMASADKLPLVRQALCILAHRLAPDDRIGVVAYAGGARVVLEPTGADERDAILKAIDGLHAGGGTAGGAGLEMAYAMARRDFDRERINRVLLATDGDFNIGIDDPRELTAFIRRQAGDGVYLNVLSVGGGNVRDDMTQALAQNGNGVAAHLDSLAEAERVLVRHMTGALFTVAKDVKFQVEFNPARIAAYRLIGYETRKLAEADFADDAKDSGDMGAGHAVTALYEVTLQGDGAPFRPRRYGDAAPAPEAPNAEFAYLRIRFRPVAADPDAAAVEQATAIAGTDAHADLAEASADARFAAAVAWFAQKLRGDAIPDRPGDWDAIIALADGARGADPEGARVRFVEAVRAAKDLDPAG